jgi:hypothetical protein
MILDNFGTTEIAQNLHKIRQTDRPTASQVLYPAVLKYSSSWPQLYRGLRNLCCWVFVIMVYFRRIGRRYFCHRLLAPDRQILCFDCVFRDSEIQNG